jgi:hypothetical protein
VTVRDSCVSDQEPEQEVRIVCSSLKQFRCRDCASAAARSQSGPRDAHSSRSMPRTRRCPWSFRIEMRPVPDEQEQYLEKEGSFESTTTSQAEPTTE